ncbi:oligosaccharide flippase family protein [Rugosimonospora acidiphila]|uniref:Oligosaccharide flippase family protein n=2 Tax=Rugosimonospora acidiphila TaxID=556531 RepID=A0ABP9SP46_9ACTN
MLAARVVMAAASLASLPVAYTRLGERAYGVWVLLGGLMAIMALADLGLGSALVREVARAASGERRGRLGAMLGLGLVWGVCAGVLALVGIALGWSWLVSLMHLGDLSTQAWHAALWLALGLLFNGVEVPWRAVLEGTQRYGALACVSGGTALAGAALAVFVLRRGGGLVELSASSAAASALRTGLIAGLARRYEPAMAPRVRGIEADDLRSMRGYGMRVQISSASAAANTEMDRFFLGGLFGPATAGGFDVGCRLLNLLRLPPGLVLVALFPAAVAGAATGGPSWLDRFHLLATRYLTVCLAPAAAALMVCADPLVRLWLGHQVSWGAANLAVLVPAYAVNLAAGAATVVTRAEGRPGRETRYVLLSVAINFALTYPLARLVGPLGVPLATAIGVVASTGYFMLHFHRTSGRPIPPLVRVVWPPVMVAAIAGTVGAVAARFLPDGPDRWGAAAAVLCRGGLILAVAGALLVASGCVGRGDWRRLRGLVRRVAPAAAQPTVASPAIAPPTIAPPTIPPPAVAPPIAPPGLPPAAEMAGGGR